MRLSLLALLVACAPEAARLPTDLAAAPALTLVATPPALVPGFETTFSVAGGSVGQVVRLGASPRLFGPPFCPPQLGGPCLGLASPVSVIGTSSFGRSGSASFRWSPPGLAPSGAVAVQAAQGPLSRVSPVLVLPTLDPSGDLDGDLLSSGTEMKLGLNPVSADSDGDGQDDADFACANFANPTGIDLDGDGSDAPCDCDDDDAGRAPGSVELPYDGRDNDCDGATADDDLDGDGFLLADDCDDDDAGVNPGAPEIPGNDRDDDCDATTPDRTCPVPLDSSAAAGESGAVAGITLAHNRWRALVGAPPLTWNSTLAQRAQAHAEVMAAACTLSFINDNLLGQNFAQDSRTTLRPAESIVDLWACERFLHAPTDTNPFACSATPTAAPSSCAQAIQGSTICGHYTQVVWDDTTQVGCGVAANPACGQFWHCVYTPRGNFLGVPAYDTTATGACLDLDHDDVLQPLDADDLDATVP